MNSHYFAGLYPHMGFGPRPCKTCGLSYDDGAHLEIKLLDPYTQYVCPNASGQGLGHVSRWTGAHLPEGRRLGDDKCMCGATLVKEDQETWQLSWEMTDGMSPWRTTTVVRSRHAAEQQRAGLEVLIGQGELIRNITLVELKAVTS